MNAPVEQMRKTLYDLLGTRPDAAREEIEQAYRAAVEKLTPEIDAGRPDALNQLRLLREAHHILTDDARRARYDAWMQSLTGENGAQSDKAHRMDGLGWAIAVTLVAIAVGAMLTVFMLLEQVEDVRTDYAETMRQKKAEHERAQKAIVVPLGDPEGMLKDKQR